MLANLRPPWIPIPIGWMLTVAGLVLIGFSLSTHAAASQTEVGALTVTRHGTEWLTTTQTVQRVVKGRVIHLQGKEVVLRVPQIIVRTDDHRIVVPAHTIHLRNVHAAVAQPNLPVTVTVYVPTTVYVPADPVTVTTTATIIVPTTITLPLTETGGPDPGE